MNASIYRISLDVQAAYANVALDAKRADTGRKIHITLTDGGFPYQISPECYAVFTATKPDGNKVFNHCTIEGNTIIYKITPQTVAAVGIAECEIKVYGADDHLLTSACFNLAINETVINEDDEIESETEVDALTHLISESTTAIYDTKEATKEARETIEELEESKEVFEQKVADARASAASAKASEESAMSSKNASQAAAVRADTSAENAKASEDAAKEAEEKAREFYEGLEPKLATKADDLHYDEETSILHLMSNGKTIGTGVVVASGGASVFVQPDEPVNAKIGELWYDTDEEDITVTAEWIEEVVADYLQRNPIDAGSKMTIGSVNLLASKWVGSESPYSQVVTISGVTAYSQVDLTPSAEQLSVFHDKDLAFVTENEDGIVTVYAIGQKPVNDYTIQVTIKEVNV